MIKEIKIVSLKDTDKDVMIEFVSHNEREKVEINGCDISCLMFFQMPNESSLQQLMNGDIDDAYFHAVTSKPPKFCSWAFKNGVKPKEKIVVNLEGC